MLLLTACAFPLQSVSPDPDLPATPYSTSVPVPEPETVLPSTLPDHVEMPSPEISGRKLENPKLAVFWYAMADAHVYDLRECCSPALQSCGIPFREFDAENDRYRQLDQIRDAVRGGWNILAVQLVSPDDTDIVAELIDVADGCPLILFDRVPSDSTLSERIFTISSPIAVICTAPEDLGVSQGTMIGSWLTGHFSSADRNGDGRIACMSMLEAETETALKQNRLCVETVDSILAASDLPDLIYCDTGSNNPWISDPSVPWPSDAANSMMTQMLARSPGDAFPVELIICSSDELALGALTALQAAWLNLGDSTCETIPLFGLGGAVSARSAVRLGQMTGTVASDDPSIAQALAACINALASGASPSSVLDGLCSSFDQYCLSSAVPCVLFVSPLPVLS